MIKPDLLRRLLDLVPDVVFLYDADGRYRYANRAALEYLERPLQEVVGRTDEELFPAAAAATIREHQEAALASGKTQRHTYPLPMPSGETREWEVDWVPVGEEELDVPGLAGVARDITRLSEARRELREERATLREVTENIGEVIWLTSPDKQEMLYINSAFEEVMGRSVQSIYEDPSLWLETVHPDDRPRVEEALPGQLTGDYDVEYRVLRPDGEVRWIRDRAYPIRDEDGEVLRVVGIAEDVTGRRALEEELRRSNRELEQFASAVSHDLREPLRMVDRYLELLARREGDRLGEDGREFLEFARDGARRMKEMIDGVLAYSQIGREKGEPAPTPAGKALESAVDHLRPRLEEAGAEVSWDELPAVRADGEQLVRLFQNLLSNAIAYRGDEPLRVTVRAGREGGRWRFSVEDNGVGIPAGEQERIFQIFQRGSAAGGEGVGIGLAICRGIVERHGGQIGVESEPGEGSTFHFTLPAAE